MKVVLVKYVPKLGHEGDVVEVSDGYARNYLIARRLAIAATDGALKDVESRHRATERKRAIERQKAQELAASLKGLTVVIRTKVGDEGRLHGSIGAEHVIDELQAQHGISLDKQRLELFDPIRRAGSYLLTVRLHKEVDAQLAVDVVPELGG